MREIQSDELKKIEMDMLHKIDKICREEGIVYYAIGGTLLGAVRHGGFIPWDDDIDIAMFERDCNKFRTVINSLESNLRFDCIEDSKDYHYAYGKVCRTDTRIRGEQPPIICSLLFYDTYKTLCNQYTRGWKHELHVM